MIENETVRLLRECDAGIQMGITSIDDSMKYVQSAEMRRILHDNKQKHAKIQRELEQLLNACHDDGKSPSAMAKGMSWVKTNVKLAIDDSDQTVADLMTDGCNMGVKKLSQYLNQYQAADDKSKHLAKELIHLEAHMVEEMRTFL